MTSTLISCDRLGRQFRRKQIDRSWRKETVPVGTVSQLATLSKTAIFPAPQTDVDGVLPIWNAGGNAIFPIAAKGDHRSVMALLVRLPLQRNLGPPSSCLSSLPRYPIVGCLRFVDVCGKQLHLRGDLLYTDHVIGVDLPVG